MGRGGVVVLVAFGILLASALPALLPARATETPTIVVAQLATPTPTRVAPTATPTAIPSSPPTLTPSPTATPIPFSWKRISTGQEFPRDQIATNSIVVDPRDPEVIYVGTQNAGVFKSVDGGISWQPASKGAARAAGGPVGVDPKDSRTVYAYRFSGPYKTTDGGESWQSINQGIEQQPMVEGTVFSFLEMDPQNGQHLYFANSNDKLYETTDGGRSWKQILTSACPAIRHVVIHPTEPQILFAIGVEERGCKNGIYKSTDGGKTWTLVYPLNNVGLSAFLTIDRTGKFIYLSASSSLYGSSDGGTSWRLLHQQGHSALAIHPDNGAIVYAVDWDGFLIKTADGGQTWQKIRKPNVVNPQTLVILPPKTLLLGGVGFFISTDEGASWVARNNGLGQTPIELQMSSEGSSMLYAGDLGCRGSSNKPLYRSMDGGRTWQSVTDRGCGFTFDAGRNTLYRIGISENNVSVLRSQDGGKTWAQGAGLSRGNEVIRDYSVVANPYKQEILLYVDQPPYVFISSDGGATWKETSGISRITQARFFFGYDQGQTVYALGRGTYRSNDGGKSWTACATIDYSAATYSKLAIDPRNNKRILVGIPDGGVVVSQDGCQSWQPSNAGFENLTVKSVAIDRKNPDHVYAGADGGAYFSLVGGKSWSAINDGLLGTLVVYSIVVDPRDSSVYASTPYGIFKLEAR